MKPRPNLAASLALASLALLTAIDPALAHAPTLIATAPLKGTDGSAMGTAKLLRHGKMLMIEIDAINMPAGVHGAHLHTVGACDAPGFKSAGGHLNPGMKMHGSLNPMGKHLGDLPNLEVMSDGTGRETVTLVGSAATLLPELFDADGTAVVVHTSKDDYRTDPSGDSGSRIACGVLGKI